ncbi:permease [Litoribacillus peritrichatus]
MSDCCNSSDQTTAKQINASQEKNSAAMTAATDSCCAASETSTTTASSCCAPASKKDTAKASGSCCGSEGQTHDHGTSGNTASSCCDTDDNKNIDWILWVSSAVVLSLYSLYLLTDSTQISWLDTMASTSFEMMNAMWWGVLLGIVLVGWLNRIPREVVVSALGPGHTKRGIFRATLAGVLLDLCNHGILMVAMKLYERGASLGQVMAFLIASPWNSFTLTLILFGLIGIPWTLSFIVFSMVIAWISGHLFDHFEKTGRLPMNPNMMDLPEDFKLSSTLKTLTKEADYSPAATGAMLLDGLKGARMVIRWIMFGVVLVALLRAFVPLEIFETWFGASVGGLFLTLLAATVIEVCSEGSTPIAADLVNRASAPGNGFTFLMAGASTDYTEIMVIKDTMKSWKIALFLPLITVPQVLFIGWVMNMMAGS